MSATGNRTPREIFVAALRLAPEQWDDYLRDECGDDTALHDRANELLRAHAEAGSFLDGPAVPLDSAPVCESPGSIIGPYKLLEQIGEGGMGLVFLAEQTEPIRRKVALKIIKPGMDTRQVVARFEAERQALALMDHPNIAKILDAGLANPGCEAGGEGETHPRPYGQGSPRPFFVMELVRGLPITEFCDQHRYTPKQRLALFVTVCQAVQHAHQKGIIHRDLKPSNILVTLHDTVPVPKIIDFGIAKALDQPLTNRTMFTNFAQMIGTPLYMSPEQAELSALDVDTRSDVYSLGVLLYVMLTGTTPFEPAVLHDVSFDEMRRIIREDEPPRPSARLSTLDAMARSTVSSRRGLDDRQLSRLLNGDLDWIVMKALEKDRNRRYESAGALAADVQRYLNDEPILAKPPGWREKAAKWGRRHKALVTSSIVLMLISIVGFSIGALLLYRAYDAEATQKRLALANLTHALTVLDKVHLPALQGMEGKRELTPGDRAYLQQVLEFYKVIARDNLVLTEDRLIYPAYSRIGSIHKRLGNIAEAERAFSRGISDTRLLIENHPNELEHYFGLGACLEKLGRSQQNTGRHSEAEATFRDYESVAVRMVDLAPNDVRCLGALAESRSAIAGVMTDTGRFPEALEIQKRALDLWQDVVRKNASDPVNRQGLAKCYHGQGMAHWQSGRFSEAAAAFRPAHGIFEELVRDYPRERDYRQWLGQCSKNLVVVQTAKEHSADNQRLIEAAIRLFRDLADEAQQVAEYREQLADSLRTLAASHVEASPPRLADAETLCREALAIAEKLAADHPRGERYQAGLAQSLHNLASVLQRRGDLTSARDCEQRAIAQCRLTLKLAPKNAFYRWCLMNSLHTFASWSDVLGDLPVAAETHREAIELAQRLVSDFPQRADYKRSLADEQHRMGGTLHNLAETTFSQGEFDTAVGLLHEAIALQLAAYDAKPRPTRCALFLRNHYSTLTYCLAVRPSLSSADYARAVDLARKALSLDDSFAEARRNLGIALYRMGKFDEAFEELNRAQLKLQGDDGTASLFLAMIHHRRGDKEWPAKFYELAAQKIDSKKPEHGHLRRLQAEAANLLAIKAEPRGSDGS